MYLFEDKINSGSQYVVENIYQTSYIELSATLGGSDKDILEGT